MGLIAVDTTFLIDWSGGRGWAGLAVREFLSHHQEDHFVLSVTALGEFAAGFADHQHHTLVTVRRSFKLLPSDEAVAMTYREVFRFLKGAGQLIGANDLWIACHALRHGLPCLTRNTEEFKRVPGLTVLGY